MCALLTTCGGEGGDGAGGAGDGPEARVGRCWGAVCCPVDLPVVMYDDDANEVPQAVEEVCHVMVGGNDAVAVAGPGRTAVMGGAGDDVVDGGPGADVLYGEAGEDHLAGGDGDDRLRGGDGNDELRGGAGVDDMWGEAGDDILRGEASDDVLRGHGGRDDLAGGDGRDLLDGGAGDDVLDGGEGDDTLFAGVGADRALGGPGDDRIIVAASCELAEGDFVDGGPGHDVLTLPVPLAQAEAAGLEVTGVEEVRVEPHPCLAQCLQPACGAGRCVEVPGTEDFTCECPARFTGERCEACAPGWDGPDCGQCAPGYHLEGPDGEGPPTPPGDDDHPAPEDGGEAGALRCVPDETCADLDCGLGTCTEDGGAAECTCPEGRTGLGCGDCLPYHEPGPGDTCVLGAACRAFLCGGRGDCVDVAVGHDPPPKVACACDEGYAGAGCTHCAPGFHGAAVGDQIQCVPDEVCGPDTCSGNGTCAVVDGVAQCTCDAGYGGPDCSRTCIGNTCGGIGTCSDGPDGPACDCPWGWDPATDCTSCAPGFSLDPGTGTCVGQACVDPQVDCSGRGVCSQAGDISICQCDAGYAGWKCETCDTGYVRFDGVCIPAATCDDDACGGRGTCQVSQGVATCACQPGAFGPGCQYDNPPTALWVTGQQRSVAPGEARELTPLLDGIGDYDRELVWTVVEGGGTLAPGAGGTMVYTPPPDAEGQALVEVHPACCQDVSITVPVVLSHGAIQRTRGGGLNDALFDWFDRSLTDYMWDRCVGALSVAVQWNGVEVYRAAYGRTRGAPTDTPNGFWNLRCEDAFDPAGRALRPTDPIRIGSNSKVLLAAMVRWAVRKKWREKTIPFGNAQTPTDAQIEAIPLCGNSMFHRYELLPPRLSDILCGFEPLVSPFPPSGLDHPKNCDLGPGSSQPCKNGGTCKLWDTIEWGDNGDVTVTKQGLCTCPDGFSGRRCEIRDDMWSGSPPYYADPRWQQVTLGDLMRHSTGNPGTAKPETAMTMIRDLRGWADIDAVRGEQASLWITHVGNAAAANSALAAVRGVPVTDDEGPAFVRRPSLEELFVATMQRALVNMPAQRYEYVNGNFSIQHLVIERLTGRPFAARFDLQNEPSATALAEFLSSELGIEGGEGSPLGIFPSNTFANNPAPEEPIRYRQWSDNQQSWYPTVWDQKVADVFCYPIPLGVFGMYPMFCNAAKWIAKEGGRFAWGTLKAGVSPSPVAVEHAGMSVSPGQGSMAVELPLWLELMGRYRVEEGRSGPMNTWGYARPRDGESSRAHFGLIPSHAASYERQFGSNEADMILGDLCLSGECPEGFVCRRVPRPATQQVEARCVQGGVRYALAPLTPDGRIPWDVPDADLVAHRCSVPAGVDVIVSVNQARDRDKFGLVAAKDIDSPYARRLRAHAIDALCRVDWAQVQMPIPFQAP